MKSFFACRISVRCSNLQQIYNAVIFTTYLLLCVIACYVITYNDLSNAL